MRMRTVAYHNLGCKVNAYEMDAMLEALRQNGYEIVPFEEQADIYIVNTCTVTNIADRKSRQMLHKSAGHCRRRRLLCAVRHASRGSGRGG